VEPDERVLRDGAKLASSFELMLIFVGNKMLPSFLELHIHAYAVYNLISLLRIKELLIDQAACV
jgi:hypothetical protein